MRTKPGKRYLQTLKKRYHKAAKPEKKHILDEFTKTTGYGRKHAIAILRGLYHYRQGKICRPRRATYTSVDAAILAKVADLFDWICSKRLKPAVPVGLKHLQAAGGLTVTSEEAKRLSQISPATIDRLLTRYQRRPKKKGRSYTKPGTLLKHHIPVRTFSDWNENKVGFEEIDLVGHDGGIAKGDFSWTLNVVDVKVCWT